jgi:hypothetical protein
MRISLLVILIGLSAGARLGSPAHGQPPQPSQQMNLDTYVELLRSDVNSERVKIFTQGMRLNEGEAAKFWPLYRAYEIERDKIGHARVAIIKEFAAHYNNLSERKTDQLALAAMDTETRRTALKRRYYARIRDAISARVAARFFQIENQIQMVVDLQVSSMLPIIK